MFVAEGQAFGNKPRPRLPGCTAVSAADSTRLGPAALGDCVHAFRGCRGAPAFRPGRSRLIRRCGVVLLDQGRVVRTASPTGAAKVVDWDTSELVGRSVVLLVEDQSATGGLVVDEIVAY